MVKDHLLKQSETRFEVQGPSEMYYEGYLMIVPDQYFDSFLFRFVASLFVCCIRGSKAFGQ